jgi:phenylacetate-CoA ligase
MEGVSVKVFWNEKLETASADELAHLQSERLKAILKYVYQENEVYRRKFDENSINPRDIKGLHDLKYLPFTTKDDLRTHYPLGMSCVPEERIREIHISSGFTGSPVVMPYTEEDLDQWSECMARCYRMAGLKEGEVIQITPSFGLFNGGFGFYHGARKAGLFIVPTGAGNTPRQIKLMNDFRASAVTGVVSYGIRIMEVLEELKEELPYLRVGIFGAETFSEPMKEKIQNGLGIEVFDVYGMTETGGVGTTGMDCQVHNGIHVWEDQYIIEVIDPETGKPLDDDEEGELVFTALNRIALPVIRFRSGDVSRILSREKCECGRTHLRIAGIKGRTDDMLIVKGVSFYPRQVEEALMSIPGVRSHYQIIIEDIDGVKDIRINVEAEEGVTGYTVEKRLKETLGFSPKGDVFRPGELPRQEGKAVRVVHEKNEFS